MVNPLDTLVPNIAVLISGRGSNMMAIHQTIQLGGLKANLAMVVSNRSSAKGLLYAQENNIPATALVKKKGEPREAYDERLVTLLNDYHIDAIVLAGYDRIISDVLIDAYTDRIVNIHPSLLPQYGGYKMVGEAVHGAVLENKETVSGATVHLVTKEVDAGKILGQVKVSVLAQDTIESLASRVLEQEHVLYSAVLQQWIDASFNNAGFAPVMIDSTIETSLSKI